MAKYTKKTYEEVQESIKNTLAETNKKIQTYFDDHKNFLSFLILWMGFTITQLEIWY